MNYKQAFTVCISSVIVKEKNFKDYRYTAKSVIEKLGMSGLRNPEDIRNQSNFEEELRENCDFLVLIMGNAPSAMVEKELRIALQRGIPILVFVKFVLDANGKKEIPDNVKQNLPKISPELYNMHIISFEDCEDLARKLEKELQESFYKKINLAPTIGLDPPVAYTEGLNLLREAKYRVVLTQRTSILVLGPRKGNTVEREFYDYLIDWINNPREHNDHTFFVHCFSMEETTKAMKTGEYDLSAARAILESLLEKYKNDSGFTVRATKKVEIVSSHLVADTGLGLNFWIGSNRYYLFLPCFLTKDRELQTIITSVQRVGTSFTKDNIAGLYGGV